ncbi:MAG: PQQ-dependent sugar dehydrogenase [Anaerolineales bacterium]
MKRLGLALGVLVGGGVLAFVLLVGGILFYDRVLADHNASGEGIYQFERVADGFNRPLYLTHAGDERLFIVEQRGLIHVLDQDYNRLEMPFLDIRDLVDDSANERGLLSVAFHPEYTENGYFFVNYTAEPDGRTVIARYAVSDDPNRADVTSAQIILEVEQPYGNHNGGLLKFGPDGYLYAGLGDGGSGGDPLEHGQNPNTLLGTLLRLDVDEMPYAIPADNPFVDGEAGAPEVWAYGLRNPWRYSFDSQTGDLYIGDVGQSAIEEIHFQPAGSAGGQNYGWNPYEGSERFTEDAAVNDVGELVFPIVEYNHNATIPIVETNITRTAHCSVTGGYVYRGTEHPDLVGQYIYGDYCSGTIWTLARDAAGEWVSEPFLVTDLSITSFGLDVDGELYLLDFANDGVYRLVRAE